MSTAQGQILAWQRRQALRELIETDPEKALALAAPFRWRQALPPEVTRHFEERVDGRGDLLVAEATAPGQRGRGAVYRHVQIGGRTFAAFVYGRRLTQVSQRNIPLHGIALDGKLALHSEPLRRLETDEATARQSMTTVSCGVCGIAVGPPGLGMAADLGGEVAWFCGEEHAKLANQRLRLSPLGGSDISAGDHFALDENWTKGIRTVLYLRVNFPDDLTEPISEAGAYHVMDQVNTFYVRNSYSTTTLQPTVSPLITLPQTRAWYLTAGPAALLQDARLAARRATYDTDDYDLDIVAFPPVGYDWAGLAYVYGKGIWLQNETAKVTAHELGHNYGVRHANFWDAGASGSAIGAGTNVEYGNPYDVMGHGSDHFSVVFKNQLRWLPDTAVHRVTSNGVYRLFPMDTPVRESGQYHAVRITKDFERDYWIEFRQNPGANPLLQNGVLLNWSPWYLSGGDAGLLKSGAPGSNDGLLVGHTFSDPADGVYITPLARSDTATNAWLDVRINLGAFPSNHPPQVKIEATATNFAFNTLVYFHAAASDPDGDPLACAWTIDHAMTASNNLPWVAARPGPGDHLVRCVVTDGKGGVASANLLVTGTNGPLAAPNHHLAGRVTDVRGMPLEGVRVDSVWTDDPERGDASAFTGSDGRFLILSSREAGYRTITALKYGCTFTNVTWTTPLFVDDHTNDLDFIAVPLPVLTLAASTNSLRENGNQAIFTLNRTGEITNELAVELFLSFSENAAGRFIIPGLNQYTNNVVFPAGESNLTLALQTVDNTLAESSGMVSLIVLETTNYAVGSFGDATIAILDDDQSGPPPVSVTAATGFVPENGVDAGRFVFTRGGGAQGDLPVYYSASGTATAGTDYPTLLGVVVIPAGHSSTIVGFRPVDDTDVEPDETVVVSLLPSAAYTISNGTAQVLIVNDDELTVTIFPTGADAAEPDISGRFTVRRDGDLTGALVVRHLVGGTAIPGSDYLALNGSVTIPAGATSAEIVVSPINDALLEGDESVIVTLTSDAAYNIGRPGVATRFIRDDETATVTITATDNTAAEPGEDFGRFTLSRGSTVNGPLTVNLAISGTAIGGVDYIPLENTVVIPHGASQVILEVIPFDDLHREPAEDVRVAVVAGTNYNVGNPNQAQVNILSDDDAYHPPAVGFTFAASGADESRSPGVSVSLSDVSTEPVTVAYRVIGGTASTNDYNLPPGDLSFEPGQRVGSLPLSIKNNSTAEANRTLRLALFDPINATLDGIKIHTYTILDDDTASVSLLATAATAAETGGAPGNFRIARNGGTNTSLVVNFAVTGTAEAPGDYPPLGNSVTIPAGATFVDLPVAPVNDLTTELPETVVLRLTGAPGATLAAPHVATVTITDNDPDTLPVVTVTTLNHPFAVEGGGNGEFLFTRSGPTNNALTLNLTLGGTANIGGDCLALTNVVTIPAGNDSTILPVTAVDDALIEGEETVVVALAVNGRYRAAHPASATVTIQDNDQRVRVDASDFIAAEPGTDTGEFTFTRFGTTNTPLTVRLAITGTASNGADYAAIPNAFVIPAGQLSATLAVVPLDDLLREGAETLLLRLLPDAAYSLDLSTNGSVTIRDDEPMVSLIAGVTNTLEGGDRPGVFTLIRSGDPCYEFTVRLGVGGTARFGVDYPQFQTNVFFPNGITAIDLQVQPENEPALEGDETVAVVILPDPAYTILPPSNAVVVINDAGNNLGPSVTITRPRSRPVRIGISRAGMMLEATVTDPDGGPIAPPRVTWSKVIGRHEVIFGDTNAANTTVSFTNSGYYVLRLTADDGRLQCHADIAVLANAEQAFTPDLLYWKLDDGSGTNALDASGSGRMGILSSGASWTDGGIAGGAVALNGGNGFVRAASGEDFLDGLEAFTVALWIKSAATDRDQGLVSGNDSSTSATLGLHALTNAHCGGDTNVYEAIIPTTEGVSRYVTRNNVLTNGWQHLALTWASGRPPALYLDGLPDRTNARPPAIAGRLLNCPQFIVGKGPGDSASAWYGTVDEVRIFSYALNSGEIYGLGGGGGGGSGSSGLPNFAPVVDAGTNFTIQFVIPAPLNGTVTDDGLPDPPGLVSNYWLIVSNAATAILADANSTTTTVTFAEANTYVFRLIADDGDVKMFDDVEVTAILPTLVNLYATDPDATELGPDSGEFLLVRDGDAEVDLPVHLGFGGIASNGADCVMLSNLVVIPAKSDSISFLVKPYLDDRTEGDEPLTISLLTNTAYTIGSSPATVTIHDSPYGVWTVDHFTLEELTDPTLSGQAADFEHDGLVNFAEYAANLEPKTADASLPLVVAGELNPDDGKTYLTLTYHRRLPPTDVAYEPAVSCELQTWLTGTNYFKELQATDDGNGLTETVKTRLKIPYPPATNQFLTVRVRLLTTGP